jgi:glutathione synthase/RimK-type ligase-like ATP-grasp enzyme
MNKTYYNKAYPIDKNKLYRNRWMFISEGILRGYDIKKIHPKKLIFFVEKNGKGFMYDTLPGSVTARTRFPQIANKVFQKSIMSISGIGTAQTFGVVRKAVDIKNIKCLFPCVVKPAIGSRSKDVVVNINTEETLSESVNEIIKNKGEAIIEKQYFGKQYRILAINGSFVSCVERRPASVVGDGKHTIAQLIEIKNSDTERGERSSMTNTLHHIVIDEVVLKTLAEQNLTVQSIVENEKVITLTTKINTSVGADLVDYTQKIHKSFVYLVEQFTKSHNFFIIGFDVIAEDIEANASEQEYIFNELNEQPFYDISEKCNIGEGTQVSSIMWDEIEKSDIMTKQFLFL